MRRKALLVILGLLLFTATAGVVIAGGALTITQVVQQALPQSARLKLSALNVEKTELSYVNTMDRVHEAGLMLYQFAPDPHPNEAELLRLIYIGPASAALEKDTAKWQKEDEEKKLTIEVQQQYLGVTRAKEHKALLQLSVERAIDLRRLAEAAYKVGTAARSDVMRADTHVTNLEASLFAAESSVKIAEAVLNTTMGRDLQDEVSLENVFTLPELSKIDDLDKAIIRALGSRTEIKVSQGRRAVAESIMNYANNTFSQNDYDYRLAEIGLEEAKLGLRAVEDGIRLEVFSLYQKLTGRDKQLLAIQKGLELANENYRISKLRYELGVGTQGEVVDAMLALSEQEIRLLNEQIDHYTDYLNWRLKTGLPVN